MLGCFVLICFRFRQRKRVRVLLDIHPYFLALGVGVTRETVG